MKKYKCAQCQAVWEMEDDKAGQIIECPKCKHKFRVHSNRKSTMKIEGESETKVSFSRKDKGDSEIDLTPMIDVNFQLLIFFMVTASYAIQKSLEVPTPDPTDEATQSVVQDIDSEDDYIVVKIEKDNSIWVESVEAPSYQDLIFKLKERKNDKSGNAPNSLRIEADNDCDYEYVVRAVDAGSAAGMNKVQLTMTSEE